jgi:hypothetical protein
MKHILKCKNKDCDMNLGHVEENTIKMYACALIDSINFGIRKADIECSNCGEKYLYDYLPIISGEEPKDDDLKSLKV